MSKLTSLPERALEFAGQFGDNFKQAMPHAGKWLDAGVKLGVLKTGARVAGLFVRRNPVVTIAAVAGAGLLWYAARRRARQAQNGLEAGAIEGSAKRVDARSADASSNRRSTSAARKRAQASSSNDTAH